jgi:PBP1b-binding outer membrane lipoprotein LpoB
LVKFKKYAASMLIGAVLVGCSAEETSEPKKTVEKVANVEVKSQSIQDKAQTEMKENFMDNKEEAVKVVVSLKRILDEPMDATLVPPVSLLSPGSIHNP